MPNAATLDDLADLIDTIDTIGYELTVDLTARLPQHYVRNGALVAIADLPGYREWT